MHARRKPAVVAGRKPFVAAKAAWKSQVVQSGNNLCKISSMPTRLYSHDACSEADILS